MFPFHLNLPLSSLRMQPSSFAPRETLNRPGAKIDSCICRLTVVAQHLNFSGQLNYCWCYFHVTQVLVNDLSCVKNNKMGYV